MGSNQIQIVKFRVVGSNLGPKGFFNGSVEDSLSLFSSFQCRL